MKIEFLYNLYSYLSDYLLTWWPWLSFWSDSFIIQIFIVYCLFAILFSTNIYYTLFYFFLLIAYFGLFLALYQMELFSGFLWLVECVVVFIFLLLLFFLKTPGTVNKIHFKLYTVTYLGLALSLIFIFWLLIQNDFLEEDKSVYFNCYDLWDDFYEANMNTNINDFVCFMISFYILNSFEFLVLGMMILVASIICVNLNRFNKQPKISNVDVFLKLFNFFKNSIDFVFLRQQNLNEQESSPAGTKIFKKKSKL